MSGSEAEMVKLRSVPSATVRLVMEARTGGLFDSITVTVKVCVALREGEPLSVTMTPIRLVVPPCVSDGVQPNTPLVELTEAPAGAPESRLNVSDCAGISGSLAVLVKVSSTPSVTVLLLMGERMGALFTSFTTIEIVSKALRAGEPLSVTRIVTLFVPGPCASVGLHVNRPDDPLMLVPEGAPGSRLNVSVWAG